MAGSQLSYFVAKELFAKWPYTKDCALGLSDSTKYLFTVLSLSTLKPAMIHFEWLFTESVFALTQSSVQSSSSWDGCTDSLATKPSDNMFFAVSCSGEVFTPDGLYESR